LPKRRPWADKCPATESKMRRRIANFWSATDFFAYSFAIEKSSLFYVGLMNRGNWRKGSFNRKLIAEPVQECISIIMIHRTKMIGVV
jgi:hypothetical protein